MMGALENTSKTMANHSAFRVFSVAVSGFLVHNVIKEFSSVSSVFLILHCSDSSVHLLLGRDLFED